MLCVVDTHAVIWHFRRAFGQADRNSQKADSIIRETLYNEETDFRLVIPTIAFVEIFDKFSIDEESARRVYYECFVPLEQCDRVDLRELDEEVLSALAAIEGVLDSHEINDKIVVATALVLEASVISCDPIIHEHAREAKGYTVLW